MKVHATVRSTVRLKAKPRHARRGVVTIEICDAVEALYQARSLFAPELRYAGELRALWDPHEFDPERFVTKGILAVALAKLSGRRVIGWGELLVARPRFDEASDAAAFGLRPSAGEAGFLQPRRGYCRVSRLDVALSYRRRTFVDATSGLPVSELLLHALLGAAPYGTEVLAEVTPDAENLFENAGFKLLDAGRWRYSR
jgi:hypothetical protein